ncbi:helix-turn-helix transcriptional regulator [Streptomyces ipomoeae]|uniref:helix-turn-helix domain-containing protein n=1 Tax=Streptomyces ipomoeae TaxID=103232 RepID=UPI0029ACE835|nr:helix-turn-helix transcriptional regulator [Streptomyces ipomoeae]MDX2825420.1 helix-turn-helix transcriptional regulator [Streptomyces ipomoeae]MDX2878028.1 helix-turn-helix transcriptional regulator [Streptomyces ipomoeae]
MTDAQPNLHRRRLGLELRSLRKEAGMSLAEAAERLSLSGAPALSKIENGKQRVPPIALAGFFETYGLQDQTRIDNLRRLASLANTGKRSNLFDQYRQSIRDPFAEYLHLEELADKSETFTWLIPGLLQTEAYARAVVERSRKWQTDREISNFVALRMARQETLTRDNPLQLWCVLDESALQREVGGKHVMRAQLEHLLEVTADHRNVVIQVLAFTHGAHAGIDGPFHLLHFPAGPPVVVVEPMTTSLYLEEDSDVGRYETAFNHLRAEALDAEASQRYIHDLIKDRYT